MTGLVSHAMLTSSLTLLLLVIGRPARAFNVDIPSALTHRGPSGSYFGFSVDVHKDRGSNWYIWFLFFFVRKKSHFGTHPHRPNSIRPSRLSMEMTQLRADFLPLFISFLRLALKCIQLVMSDADQVDWEKQNVFINNRPWVCSCSLHRLEKCGYK